MANFIRIWDAVEFQPTHISPEIIQEYTEMLDGAEKPEDIRPLRIRIAATHAGKVTRNNGFYLPDKMRIGATSFTSQFPKPILVHHKEDTDPIGRIYKASYIDISNGISDIMRNSFSNQIILLQDFVNGILSINDAIDFSIKNIINNIGLSDNPDYEGLGYIELIADIKDASAIRKVLDGTYLTGSTSATTNQAMCSICKKDWAKTGRCVHRPGQLYDKAKCVIIAGDLTYDEYSFVNKPADKHSRVIEINVNGIQDSVYIDNNDIPDIILVAVKKTMEDSVMDPVKEFFGDSYEEILGDDSWGKDYAEMLYSLLDNITDPEEIEKVKKQINDAKLSAKQRKALASSTFCGPDRSFPIPDCCFFGPQKIKTLKGQDIAIKDIVEKINNKEEVWVYGFDMNTKTIVPKRVIAAWKANIQAEVLKITLDNNEEIICTPNHPFLTRDMNYIEASKLNVGQSLMPLYTKKCNLYQETAIYEKVYQPWYRFWEYTHHMVTREVNSQMIEKNNIIHHINKNKLDNTPNNLEILSKAQHMRVHKLSQNKEKSFTVDYIKARSNFMKNRMAHILNNESLSAAHSDSISKGRRIYNWDKIDDEIGNSGLTLIDIYLAKTLGVQLKFIAQRLQIEPSTLRSWIQKADFSNVSERSNDIVRTLVEDYFSYLFGYSLEKIYEDYLKNPNLSILQDRYKIDRSILKKWFIKAGFETDKLVLHLKTTKETKHSLLEKWKSGEITLSWLKNRTGNQSLTSKDLYNHKIVAIEKYPVLEDVYDIEVEDTNNFALSAGVFVHNSHYFAGLRLLGRYKGPGSKESIRACIMRKGKRLGCTSSKTDSVKESKMIFDTNYFDTFSDEELGQMLDGLQNTFKERKLECKCNELKDDAKVKELEALLAAKEVPQEDTEQLQQAKDEIKHLHEDINNLNDTVALLISDVKSAYVNHIVDLKTLNNEVSNIEELKNKSVEDIFTILKDSISKVDMRKITDTLKSGLSNNPTEKVEDPTVVQDNLKIDEKKKLTDKEKSEIRFHYMKLRYNSGEPIAKQWLDNYCKENNIESINISEK